MRKATWLLAGIVSVTLIGCKRAPSGPAPTADWPMYNRDYASTRFSALTDITADNVTTLRQICFYTLPEQVMFESGLVAVNGTLYFTTFEYTYAIDAATCALRWRARHELPATPTVGSTRGVALAGNRVFRGSADGYVTAYDAATGNQVWSTKITADGSLESISASPIAWNGMVFIGTAGADMGNTCRIAALDAATGRVVWSFPLIPTGADANADSWPKGTHLAGGSNWTSLTLDPASGALYVPAGNPGPDFDGAYRPGANLYAGSVVVLDAKTGALRTWYQLVPHDVHDWDIAAAPVLISTRQGPRLMTAGKDGFLHAIDLASGKVAWKTPVTTIDNVDAPLTAQGTHFCPGTAGGVEWNGPAYSAAQNLVYVNSTDWCATVKLDPHPPKFEPGKPFIGSANGFGTMDASPKRGWLNAVDADTGAVRWHYQSPTPMVAGIVATASGLVMTADLNGDFLVFDAATGNRLHKMGTGQPAGGGVITYRQGEDQKVALAAGLNSRIFGTQGQPVILVFGL